MAAAGCGGGGGGGGSSPRLLAFSPCLDEMYPVHAEYLLPQGQNDIRGTAPHVIDIVLISEPDTK